jgi:hypothetical protein
VVLGPSAGVEVADGRGHEGRCLRAEGVKGRLGSTVKNAGCGVL